MTIYVMQEMGVIKGEEWTSTTLYANEELARTAFLSTVQELKDEYGEIIGDTLTEENSSDTAYLLFKEGDYLDWHIAIEYNEFEVIE